MDRARRRWYVPAGAANGAVSRRFHRFAAARATPFGPHGAALSKLLVLLITAFVDMVGLLMVVPLIPFYATDMGGGGLVVGLLVSSFSLAQLLSAPLWGRFSDRYGRRPALLVGLGASAIAYVIFGLASSLWLLLASRLVQGAGGGTVGVLQAYIADATEPKDRAKSLGWLSAATNLGVMIGPTLGSLSSNLGHAAPGMFAAALCTINAVFAFFYLRESKAPASADDASAPPPVRPREVMREVLTHPGDPAPRLIWIYSVAIGAFMGFTAVLPLFLAVRFGVTKETIGYLFAWNGAIAVLVRAFILGKAVDRFGEARLSRWGQVTLALGLVLLPFTWRVPGVFHLGGWEIEHRIVVLALVIALVPLGTAFTFPCVTALLSQVIEPRERGVVMGVQQSFGGAARVIFPALLGFVFERVGVPYPFWISAALVAATLFMSFGLEPRPKPAPKEAAVAAD
ncbi:MAG TPA: MFS transporter [Longimicrobium sp.]|nr:MFS transporter [Longimicrobium sp.]